MNNGWRWAALVCGLLMLAVALLPLATPSPDSTELSIIFGLTFGVLGLFTVVFSGIGLMASHAFTFAHLGVDGPARLGGSTKVLLTLTPRKPLAIRAASKLVVTCTEEAVYGAGTRQRTYRDTLFTHEQPLQLPENFTAPHTQTYVIAIPRSAAPSWTGSNNSFFTTVTAYVDIDNWPDLKLEARVKVLPEVAS